jgi:hypothetical protein
MGGGFVENRNKALLAIVLVTILLTVLLSAALTYGPVNSAVSP